MAKSYRPGAHHPGGDRKRTQFHLAAGEHKTGVDVELSHGGVEITGTVADITGGPIAHARVWASEGQRWRRGSGATTHGETDEQGRFSLWVKPGEITVTAAADGYADNEEGVHAPGKVEILLTPESSLPGTVVDAATNQPVEGARVLVGTSEWGWDDGEFTKPKHRTYGQWRGYSQVITRVGQTDTGKVLTIRKRFYRGLDDQPLPDDKTRNVQVIDAAGNNYTDHPALAGSCKHHRGWDNAACACVAAGRALCSELTTGRRSHACGTRFRHRKPEIDAGHRVHDLAAAQTRGS